jgi:hypothetical protein
MSSGEREGYGLLGRGVVQHTPANGGVLLIRNVDKCSSRHLKNGSSIFSKAEESILQDTTKMEAVVASEALVNIR